MPVQAAIIPDTQTQTVQQAASLILSSQDIAPGSYRIQVTHEIRHPYNDCQPDAERINTCIISLAQNPWEPQTTHSETITETIQIDVQRPNSTPYPAILNAKAPDQTTEIVPGITWTTQHEQTTPEQAELPYAYRIWHNDQAMQRQQNHNPSPTLNTDSAKCLKPWATNRSLNRSKSVPNLLQPTVQP